MIKTRQRNLRVMAFYEKITELQAINSYSKHEQLVTGIRNAIDAKIIQRGDKLPSINEMVAELGFARKTIVKAYEELKDRGLVESKKLKGYFVISEETKQTLKVALILFAFHSFQEEFYNTFREHLGPNVQLDVFFHHNNPEIFNTILTNIENRYGMYVVAPIQSNQIARRLTQIPAEKLLLVDRYLKMEPGYSFITQEFEHTTLAKLNKLLPKLSRYQRLVLFFKDKADYPIGIRRGFEKFVEQNNLQGQVYDAYDSKMLQPGSTYIFISDTNLFKLIRDCMQKELEIGKDIGIISHNDSLVKEIIAGGITTISTDFKEMARKAALFVNERGPVQEVIPTALNQRQSL
ncbi:MAG: GntR family transcriptional regulator [Bacteroidota bacterium]